VVEGFGLGGVHNMRRNHAQAIERLLKQGMPVVLTTQCLYEFSTPDVYEVSRSLAEAGVISAGDMTTEAAVTKLMWVLGRTRDMDEIRRLMQTSLCGEIGT
jgi:L-asparaginase